MNRTVSCTIQISYIIVFILFYCIPASAQINDVPPELKNRIYLDGNFGLVGSGSAYYERHLYRFKYNRVKLAARIGVGHNYYIMYNDPVKNFISTGFTILIGNYKHNLDLTGGLFAGLEGKDKSEETPVYPFPIAEIGYRYQGSDGLLFRSYIGIFHIGTSIGYSF